MKKQKAMFIVDENHRILYLNDECKHIYPNLLVGSKCELALENENGRCEFSNILESDEDKFFWSNDKEWLKADYVRMEYEGKPAYCIMFTRWVNQAKSDASYDIKGVSAIDSFLERNSNCAILAQGFNDDFPIFYSNDKALELLGYNSYDELIEETHGLLINLIHKDDMPKAIASLDNVKYEGTAFSLSYRLRCKNGEYLWIIDYAKVFNDKFGNPVILDILLDMSDVAKLKDEIDKKNRILFEENQKLMFMTNDQPTAYCRCMDDEEYTLLDYSNQLCSLIGYSRHEIETLFSNKYINLIYPDDLESYKNMFSSSLALNELYENVYRLKHKDKGFIYIKDITKLGIYNGIKYMHCSLLDITIEINQQLELKRRNKQLELINSVIPGGFKITRDDKSFSFTYVSQEAASLFGYTVDEFKAVANNNILDSIYPEDLAEVKKKLKYLRNKNEFSVKYRIKCKNGKLKSIIDTGKAIYTPDGEKLYYSFYLDITKDEERDKLIELQKNNLLQLRLIHALSRDFNVVYKLDLSDDSIKLIYVDSVAEKYIKAYSQRFSGYYDRMEFYLKNFIKEEEDRIDLSRKAKLSNVRAELDKGSAYLINYKVNVMGLTQYYQAKYARLSHDDPNEVIMGIRNLSKETNQFITEREELSMKLMDAKEASKAKTTFLNSMSHDIRTPMNAIIGFTNLAIKYIKNEDVALEYLKKISKSSEHLMALINDILDMSRIESGKITITPKETNMADLIHDIKSMVQLDVKAKGIGFYIENEIIHEDLYLDSVRISQVLLNLLSNSIKFTPAGGTIKVKLKEDYNENDRDYAIFTLEVKDSGIGMSKEFLKTIFEPFVRERTSTVSGIQGTGLGMAITKSIIDLMGGTIEVDSEKGVGSTFTIKCKFKINHDVAMPELGPLFNRRGLVIDDSAKVCIDMCEKLRRLGFRPDYTTEPEDALPMAKRAFNDNDRYDFYLIDWIMPNTNGVSVAKALRMEVGNDPTMILASTYDLSEVEVTAKNEGLDYFVSKPVFLTDLKRIVYNKREKGINRKDDDEYSFTGRRILLAEDNLFNQEIAMEILKDAGFLVEVAENGRVALDMLLEHIDSYYDLILMDIQMPVLDGYQATKIIRRLPNLRLRNIPIIAMSANVFDENIKNSLQVGMNAHLSKPINVPNLKKTLKEILNK